MNNEYLLVLTLIFGFLIFLVQRAEQKYRRMVLLLVFLLGGLLNGFFILVRGAWSEGLVGFLLALTFNFLFWLLIGRYNPVGSSDDIQVLGLDD
jgi:cytochrome bd-type quinol oxidase subunit 1